MTREIKFRGWDVFNAEMFPKKINDDLLVAFFRSVNERRNGGNFVHVMEYTGLQDCNGVEIFESDIVSAPHHYGVGQVRFGDGFAACFVISNPGQISPGPHLLGVIDEGDIEVIGNIYENPDLLPEGAE